MAQLTPELEAALGSLGTGQDPLDVPNFDPVDYINQKFPTEASAAEGAAATTRATEHCQTC